MKELRPDQLSGQKLKINQISVTIDKKIGEGGSAFVYLARPDVGSSRSAGFSTIANIGRSKKSKMIDEGVSESTKSSSDNDNDNDDDRENNDKKRQETIVLKVNNENKLKKSRKVRDHFWRREREEDYIVLKTTLLGSKDHRKQARSEVKMLKKLSSHPNVVKMIAASEDRSHCLNDNYRIHFLLLEHCRGGSLMDLIMKQRWIREQLQKEQQQQQKSLSSLSKPLQKRTPGTSKRFFKSKKIRMEQEISEKLDKLSGGFLSIEDILEIFQQICAAVAFLHDRFDLTRVQQNSGQTTSQEIEKMSPEEKEKYRKPIVHRDLKPENILLVQPRNHSGIYDGSFSWQCKLCDFGSAIEGRIPLTSREDRQNASDKIQKSTTQIYRAPEMIDLHMADELTEK